MRNPFSVYCNNYVEIISQCSCRDIKECYSVLVNNWYECVSDEMNSNINVLREIVDIRDGMKECVYLGAHNVQDIIDEICLR